MASSNGNGPSVERRIRAAMELAGIDSFERLSAAIGHEGLGARTLRKLADPKDDSRTAQRLDLVAIADACGLPYEFFTIDFTTLRGTEPSVSELLEELQAQQAEDATRLAQLEEAVTRLLSRDRPALGEAGGPR